MMTRADGNLGYVEVQFPPQWTYINCIQTFVLTFFSLNLVTSDAAQRVCTIVTELLENAVKYSSRDRENISIMVRKTKDRLSTVVSNVADEEHVATLHRLFDEINQLQPLEAYQRRLHIAATRRDGKNQVGLARVRYEGNAEMRLSTEENLVTIAAVYKNLPSKEVIL